MKKTFLLFAWGAFALSTYGTATFATDSISQKSLETVEPSAKDSLVKVIEVDMVKTMIEMKAALDSTFVEKVFTDTAVMNKYNRLLLYIVNAYNHSVAQIDGDSILQNPRFFRLFAPLTLYHSPIDKVLSLDSLSLTEQKEMLAPETESDRNLQLVSEIDKMLLLTYLNNPQLVKMTEEVLRESRSVSEKAIKESADNVRLEVPKAAIQADSRVSAPTDVVVSRPNFWSTSGSFSNQWTENYFSPNWFKGGTTNLNILSTVVLEANYNDKKRISFDNKLETKLGFYKNEGVDDVQTSEDLLRVKSKLGLKAIRNWNYTIEAQGYTQFMQTFKDDVLRSRFFAPAYGTVSIGMDYKKSFKKGNLSVFVGPLTYNCRYVSVKDVAKYYGIKSGRDFLQDFGTKIEANFSYKLTNNVSYKSRVYYYSSYKYVQADWENTFNFQVNKFLSATLFLHSRYDDSINPYEDWKYLQFKEYLTLGFNYAW